MRAVSPKECAASLRVMLDVQELVDIGCVVSVIDPFSSRTGVGRLGGSTSLLPSSGSSVSLPSSASLSPASLPASLCPPASNPASLSGKDFQRQLRHLSPSHFFRAHTAQGTLYAFLQLFIPLRSGMHHGCGRISNHVPLPRAWHPLSMVSVGLPEDAPATLVESAMPSVTIWTRVV